MKRPKHFNLGSVPRPDELKRLWKVKREHAIAKKTIKPFNISELITRMAHAGHLREDPDRLIASIFLVRIQNDHKIVGSSNLEQQNDLET